MTVLVLFSTNISPKTLSENLGSSALCVCVPRARSDCTVAVED